MPLPAEIGPSYGHSTKRQKTGLACDTCRQRKSRCDSRRPKCTHCEDVGLACSYRPTPTNLESDSAVLSRLTRAEARLDTLEASVVPNNGTQTTEMTSSQSPKATNITMVPDFHTAAGHKLLQYWSRIHVKLTIPAIDPLRYLKMADDSDSLLHDMGHEATSLSSPASAYASLTCLFDNRLELPPVLAELFLVERFSRENVLPFFTTASDADSIPLHNYSLVPLLLLSVAAATTEYPLGFAPESCFSIALTKMWTIFSGSDDGIASTMLLTGAIFLYFFGKPFHTLGILKSSLVAIERLALTDHNDVKARARMYSCIHFLLESDILTEIDGLPSKQPLDLLISEHDLPPKVLYSGPSVDHTSMVNGHPSSAIPRSYLAIQVWLRGCLNNILGLYTTDRAYCHPHEVGALVSNMFSKLNSWYLLSPVDLQFPRSLSSFALSSQLYSIPMRDLALRYHACIFLLNRTNLYSVLYEDMEHSATSPGEGISRETVSQHFTEPWVIESCRACIESACLLILFQESTTSTPLGSHYHNWCDLQLLTASYTVLLQVQSTLMLAPLSPKYEDIENILDTAETVMHNVTYKSNGIHQTLDILMNIRHNFGIQTPG